MEAIMSTKDLAIEIQNYSEFLKHEYCTPCVEYKDGAFEIKQYYPIPHYDDGGSIDSIDFEEDITTIPLKTAQEWYDDYESKMCETAEYYPF
jgi:hypothetical protein